jgi:flagellar FliL protein
MCKKCIEFILYALFMCALPASVLAADAEAENAEMKSAYVSLGKAMVLNLSNHQNKLTFLQVKADVLVNGEDAKEVVESHIPAIRHQLILLLSEQHEADMKSSAKREEIRQQATTEIRSMIEKMSNNKDVEEILFSQFLVQ